MMSLPSPRYDIARFGAEVFRTSPRQADLMIVSGRVSHKMSPPLRQVYDQMLVPKWVMAMGACSSSGGMFANYAILQGVDKIVPVDVHVPGCPPRPEAVLDGLRLIQQKIRAGIAARLRAGEVEGVTADELAEALDQAVPGAVVAHEERHRHADAHGARRAGCSTCAAYLRDEQGKNFLSAVSAVDHLGYGEDVAGYFGTERGRDLNATGSWGAAAHRDGAGRRASASPTTWPTWTATARRPSACALQVLARRRPGRCPAWSGSGRPPTGTSASSTT